MQFEHTQPRLIEFPKIGSDDIGFITPYEDMALPFHTINRVYYSYNLADRMMKRGLHAHYDLEQLLIASKGDISIELEGINGDKSEFQLTSPHIALYVPKMYWRDIYLQPHAILLVLASLRYDEADYIRDYDYFKQLQADYQAGRSA